MTIAFGTMPLAVRDFHACLGNTPMMTFAATRDRGTILAKCEWHNPCGSIKDRTAFAMLADLLSDPSAARLRDVHLLEYSGGNLAVTLAQLCNALKIPLTLVLSSATGPTLLDRLHRLGADVRIVDKEAGFWGVMEHARELHVRNPDWTFLYQHENEANIRAHREGTGQELVRALAGKRLDAWVASIGTGGTLMGVYQALVPVYPAIKVYGVSPAELPYGSPLPPTGARKYAGSGGLGWGRKQRFVQQEEHAIERFLSYGFPETLTKMRRVFHETGVRIGSSAAANLMAAEVVARELGPNSTVATIFPCKGSSEEWQMAGIGGAV